MKNHPAVLIGFWYDVHRLVKGRPLILGGVEIPHTHGLLGHSDADVLTHALCDALLGAASLGDIGTHFPDSDPAYRGISSLVLLKKTRMLLKNKKLTLGNADLTLVAQQPKIAPHIQIMRDTLASVLKSPVDAINIKATTTEGLGPAGREEGIAAYAVVTLYTSEDLQDGPSLSGKSR